jgi:hypothetical protein
VLRLYDEQQRQQQRQQPGFSVSSAAADSATPEMACVMLPNAAFSVKLGLCNVCAMSVQLPSPRQLLPVLMHQ